MTWTILPLGHPHIILPHTIPQWNDENFDELNFQEFKMHLISNSGIQNSVIF